MISIKAHMVIVSLRMIILHWSENPAFLLTLQYCNLANTSY